jgi:SAM-dependent methyltransferase
MQESSKALLRRLQDTRYATRYFVGAGIDIGCGDDPLSKYNTQFPLMKSLRMWDLPDGDAQKMATIEDDKYDFVHSSHCLEHMFDPHEAFTNWVRITKPGGHLVITIPDEDLYEQGQWPSTYNGDHKTSWTICKSESWSPVSVNLFAFLFSYAEDIEILKVELINGAYVYGAPRMDQTAQGISESAIEFVVRKRTQEEKDRKGRLFTK